MRFGVNAWVWVSPLTTEGIAELAPKVKALGFDWFEVPLELTDSIDYAPAGAILRDNGLGVSVCAAMGPDRDLIHPDKAIRDNGLAYLKHCVDAVRALGGTNVAGPLYSAVGRVWQMTAEERAHDTDLLVAQLKELAAYAGDKGAVLGVEPLNRFETSFINLAAQAIEVVDRVDHPACGIMLDTFHMNIEEKSLGDAIRATGKRLVHLHACENDRGAPGSGNVTWGEVAAALREIGYDGPVVIESFTSKVQSIARAAAIWRPLAASQDALAGDGVKFLRALLA
ncbi:MAG: sugar phosphate isomerase/epimerase [Anaerolineae bacterium]|nr:sugar phosphate isomerase/epimerase [Anaerolineae bacterium]MEB2288487.1 sugar phosphate isomerase/epimerase [Anaerolineae bacterium]